MCLGTQTPLFISCAKARNSDWSVSVFQLLERAGQWSQVAETSQLISDIKYRLIYIFQYHRDFYHPEEDYLQVGTPAAADVVHKYYLWIYFQRKLKYCSDWLELSEKLYKGRNYQRLLIQYEWMNAAGRNHRIIIKLNTLYLLLLSFRQNTSNYSYQPNDTHMSKYLHPKSKAKHF